MYSFFWSMATDPTLFPPLHPRSVVSSPRLTGDTDATAEDGVVSIFVAPWLCHPPSFPFLTRSVGGRGLPWVMMGMRIGIGGPGGGEASWTKELDGNRRRDIGGRVGTGEGQVGRAQGNTSPSAGRDGRGLDGGRDAQPGEQRAGGRGVPVPAGRPPRARPPSQAPHPPGAKPFYARIVCYGAGGGASEGPKTVSKTFKRGFWTIGRRRVVTYSFF